MRRFGLVRFLVLLAGCIGFATAAQAFTIAGTYFYSLFGDSEAGFEEWGIPQQADLPGISVVPEPGAMLLVGTGLLLAARRLRKT